MVIFNPTYRYFRDRSLLEVAELSKDLVGPLSDDLCL